MLTRRQVCPMLLGVATSPAYLRALQIPAYSLLTVQYDHVVVSSNGASSAERFALRPAVSGGIDYCPSTCQIVYQPDTDRHQFIVSDVTGGTLATIAGKWVAQRFCIASYGSAVFFVGGDGSRTRGQPSAFLLELRAGASPRRCDVDMSWKTVASFSWRNTAQEIALELDGRIKRLDLVSGVSIDVAVGRWPAWSPSGRRLAFYDPDEGVQVFDASTGSRRSLANGRRLLGPYRWSRDDRFILGWKWQLPFFRSSTTYIITALDDDTVPVRVVPYLADTGTNNVFCAMGCA